VSGHRFRWRQFSPSPFPPPSFCQRDVVRTLSCFSARFFPYSWRSSFDPPLFNSVNPTFCLDRRFFFLYWSDFFRPPSVNVSQAGLPPTPNSCLSSFFEKGSSPLPTSKKELVTLESGRTSFKRLGGWPVRTRKKVSNLLQKVLPSSTGDELKIFSSFYLRILWESASR